MHWRYAPQTAWQIVAGEAIVLDLASGAALGLNSTGTFIWSRLEANDDTEISRALAESFGIPTDDAWSDVRELVRDLEQRQLIVPAEDR